MVHTAICSTRWHQHASSHLEPCAIAATEAQAVATFSSYLTVVSQFVRFCLSTSCRKIPPHTCNNSQQLWASKLEFSSGPVPLGIIKCPTSCHQWLIAPLRQTQIAILVSTRHDICSHTYTTQNERSCALQSQDSSRGMVHHIRSCDMS